MQRFIDRRFNRSAYEASEIAAEFAGKLQHTLTIEKLADIWAGTVETSLRPRTVGIWLSAEKGWNRVFVTVSELPCVTFGRIEKKGEEDDRCQGGS